MEKPGDTFKCHLVSWDEAYSLAKILAHKIKSSGYNPDLVIGIARGGLVPARVVCDFLLQKDLAAIKVEHWGIAATLGKAKLKYPLPVDISGKSVLVVDDVVDTGDTFSVIMDYIKEKNPSGVKTAVLHYKTSSTYVPDYWAQMQDKWQWIIYPWAVYEDLTGFIKKVLTGTMAHDDIRFALKNNYGIKLSKNELLEILDDMQATGDIQKIKEKWTKKKL